MLLLSTLLPRSLNGSSLGLYSLQLLHGNSHGFSQRASQLMDNWLTQTVIHVAGGKKERKKKKIQPSQNLKFNCRLLQRALSPSVKTEKGLKTLLTVCRKHCLLTCLKTFTAGRISCSTGLCKECSICVYIMCSVEMTVHIVISMLSVFSRQNYVEKCASTDYIWSALRLFRVDPEQFLRGEVASELHLGMFILFLIYWCM